MTALRVLATLCAILAVWVAALADPHRATAQVPGTIAGIVRPGPGSEASASNVLVQLIALGQGPTVVQETRTVAGRFRFEIDRIDPAVNYLARAVVDDVGYLSDAPVQLSAARPNAQAEVVIFNASAERPTLNAAISAITIVEVDRAAGTLTLQREDAVANPSKLTWTGDPDGVTLRLPKVEGALAAQGQAWFNGLPTTGDMSDTSEGVVVRVPFRPGETMLITRYTVAADLAAPQYELRAEAVLPTLQLQVMVPNRFARKVVPTGDALEGPPMTVEDQQLRVVQRSRPAQPGDIVAAGVVGLAAPVPPHPLTVPVGAGAGFAVVLAVVTAAGVYASRRGGDRLAPA